MGELIQPRPLILASMSPRRAELLRAAGYEFDIASPPMEEPQEKHPQVDPSLYVESLAYFKARSLALEHFDQTILAADTIAVLNDEIIGKPVDRDDARRILRSLSDTVHRVMTGLAILSPSRGHRMLLHEISRVRCKPLSAEMIEAFLDTDQWRGKAGAYGIQDRDDPFMECVEGSFTNVMGLPMELLERMFTDWTENRFPRPPERAA